jgi:hypothetical protein
MITLVFFVSIHYAPISMENANIPMACCESSIRCVKLIAGGNTEKPLFQMKKRLFCVYLAYAHA